MTLNSVRSKSLADVEELAVLVARDEDTRLTRAGSRLNGRKEHKNRKNKLFQMQGCKGKPKIGEWRWV